MIFEQRSTIELRLITPDGEKIVAAHIEYQADDKEQYELNEDNISLMTVTVDYKGKIIIGHGRFYPWIDAFVDLQRQLPINVTIKGCVSCRHGNMCPVGNYPYEVFCTNDVIITQADDLWEYTETDKERSKRSREYTQVCEKYEKQSKEYYTYTDYVVN